MSFDWRRPRNLELVRNSWAHKNMEKNYSPTMAQIKYLKDLTGMPDDQISRLTRGEVSDIIQLAKRKKYLNGGKNEG